ncbi:unnamed protein product [Ceutorhynchus assimilis]|uniref:TM7S3/TM198-like domain-containing protein n=1 Tax=Ceutorhynchus assimilis TaxID=467358 RepID=A0A9N9MDD5_9CUCU|nr:unnamed protein product [Ceutorhynchus assimilis]
MHKLFLLLWFVACISLGFGASYYPQITVDLSNSQPGTTVTKFATAVEAAYTINVININASVDFFNIQIHTFNEIVALSYDDPMDVHSYTNGTNIGLIWKEGLEKYSMKRKKENTGSAASGLVQFYLFRNHQVDEQLDFLIIVTTYTRNNPIPGGCNLSFETEIAPYQKVNQSDEIITVMSQPPSLFGEFCNKSNITTEMYYFYLKEYDNNSQEYFEVIQKMATPDNITKYGTKVPDHLSSNKFKQMYNNYRGTGRVFAVVSTYEGEKSAYVPATSFGCNLQAWEEECLAPVEPHWKVVIALLLIFGVIICFSGHQWFKFGLFVIGYTFGVIIMLIMVTVDNDFSSAGKAVYALLMGIFVAIAWIFLWWKYGIPFIAVFLAFILMGGLIASIVFYSPLGNFYIFTDEPSFWLAFSSVLIISLLPMVTLTSMYYIIALSLLGSYAIIVALNYYFGGNLPYILINTYRRMTVKNFGTAVINPPFQTLDIWQTVLWILLFATGVHVQIRKSLGKPPFPPHRNRSVRNRNEAMVNEETPLLYPEMPPPYTATR